VSTKNEIFLSCKGCLDSSYSSLLISFLSEVPGFHLTKWGQIAWLIAGCVPCICDSISVVALSISLAIHLILSSVLFSYFFSVSLYSVSFYLLLSGLFNSLFYRIYVRESTCCVVQTGEKCSLTEIWPQDIFTQSVYIISVFIASLALDLHDKKKVNLEQRNCWQHRGNIAWSLTGKI
jgi:hypothetical protein